MSWSRMWFPWTAGPEAGTDGPVIIALTDYTMNSLRSLPGITRTGTRLSRGWYGLPGAVGVHLWADPVQRRTGSLSVWTDLESMRRWVGLPLHVKIMRRYRPLGSLRSTTWHHDRFARDSILDEANTHLSAWTVWLPANDPHKPAR